MVANTDGEVPQEFTFVYLGTIASGELKMNNGPTASEWMSLEKALQVPLEESQRRRLDDLPEFRRSGKIALK